MLTPGALKRLGALGQKAMAKKAAVEMPKNMVISTAGSKRGSRCCQFIFMTLCP